MPEYQKSLIQQMKEAYEFTQIKEKPLREYYTCVRYNNVKLFDSPNSGPMGTGMTYYGPGEWSCMKGWYETYDNSFRGNRIDSKVVNYCKFRNTEEALKEELCAEFIIFTPKKKRDMLTRTGQ